MHIIITEPRENFNSSYLILLSQDDKAGLIALGAALEDSHELVMGIITDILPIDLEQHVSLLQLGTAGVVHDHLHKRAKWGLT